MITVQSRERHMLMESFDQATGQMQAELKELIVEAEESVTRLEGLESHLLTIWKKASTAGMLVTASETTLVRNL